MSGTGDQSHVKPSNPKDAFGVKKVSLSYVPTPVLLEMALGMQDGGGKYGRHNFRVIGVRGSVYYDAAIRHLMAWWEGEDIDPDSGLSHITKAMTSLAVLRDAMIQGKFDDDRPPRSQAGWVAEMNTLAAEIVDRYPNFAAPYTEAQHGEKARSE